MTDASCHRPGCRPGGACSWTCDRASEPLPSWLAAAVFRSDVNLPMEDPLDISCHDVGTALAPFVESLVAEAVTAERARVAAALNDQAFILAVCQAVADAPGPTVEEEIPGLAVGAAMPLILRAVGAEDQSGR